MNKILIIAAKFYNDPTGGGGTLVKQLIDTLIEDHRVDLVLFRSRVENYYKHKNLGTHFNPVKERTNNKFLRRISNYEHNIQYLEKNFNLSSYKRILVVHVSKMFGFEKFNSNIKSKIILFPMYLSMSYERSKELVPNEYKILESSALKIANRIITPSLSERSDLTQNYKISASKVRVISRGVDEFFYFEHRQPPGNELKLITVSSFKPQKNVIESVKILNILLSKGINCKLTLIGSVDYPIVFQEILDFISEQRVERHVEIFHKLSLKEVALHMQKSDVLLLPSHWETFGRVVYEGFASGLPAIVNSSSSCFNGIETFKCLQKYASTQEAAKLILDLFLNKDYYSAISQEALNLSKNFPTLKESKLLLEEILWLE